MQNFGHTTSGEDVTSDHIKSTLLIESQAQFLGNDCQHRVFYQYTAMIFIS
jgi:hypothetical protein